MLLGRKVVWDPNKGEFLNDNDANHLRVRAVHGAWIDNIMMGHKMIVRVSSFCSASFCSPIICMRTFTVPITLQFPVTVYDQGSFHTINEQVIGMSFDIHNEFGRYLKEGLYRNELARRCRAAPTASPRPATSAWRPRARPSTSRTCGCGFSRSLGLP